MSDNKTEPSGLEDAKENEIENKVELVSNDGTFYYFKLKDNKIGSILKSTLYANRKNADCTMLCRFCGIDIGDGLKAKIDGKNFYYDSKQDLFTLFEDFLSWQQFGIFKHWIRKNNLDIIGIAEDKNELEALQRVSVFLGMDQLSKSLYKKSIATTYNPMNPSEDYKQLYVWTKSHINMTESYHHQNFVSECMTNNYTRCENDYWRKEK
eukprot:UN03015